MKNICHRIFIQTLLFQACLPTRQNGVENRDKAYSFEEEASCRNRIVSFRFRSMPQVRRVNRELVNKAGYELLCEYS